MKALIWPTRTHLAKTTHSAEFCILPFPSSSHDAINPKLCALVTVQVWRAWRWSPADLLVMSRQRFTTLLSYKPLTRLLLSKRYSVVCSVYLKPIHSNLQLFSSAWSADIMRCKRFPTTWFHRLESSHISIYSWLIGWLDWLPWQVHRNKVQTGDMHNGLPSEIHAHDFALSHSNEKLWWPLKCFI